jgi:uncharacterized membrane protein YdjX (TVP38/TMEM64 family)
MRADMQADGRTAPLRPTAFPRRAVALLAPFAAVLAASVAFRSVANPAAAAAAIGAARELVAGHPLFAALGFAVLYTIVAALAVPAIWAMNVAAGALFGPWIGLTIAVASSVTGATITMLAARYALRGWVETRFPATVARFDEGAANAGARFLFAARLAPIIPFPCVNLAAGLTSMPAKTFALVSLAGVLPLSFAYVTAGAELSALRSPAEALSPGFIALLIALASAPFAVSILCKRRNPLRT